MCFNCNSKKVEYTVKLISTNRDDIYYPKFIPQVKQVCGECGKYIKFAKQTEDLIHDLNQEIERIVIYGEE